MPTPHRPKVDYDEHEGTFEELATRLGIKLAIPALAKSEGLSAEDAKK